MKFDIDGLWERLKKTRDKDKEKLEFYPKRDWVVLISFFLIFSFALTFFYRFLFVSDYSNQGTEVSLLGNPQELSLENISKTRLNLILRKWEEKKKKYGELIDTRPNFDFLQ